MPNSQDRLNKIRQALDSDIYSKIDDINLENEDSNDSTTRLANILDGYNTRVNNKDLEYSIDDLQLLENEEVEIEVDEDEILKKYNDGIHSSSNQGLAELESQINPVPTIEDDLFTQDLNNNVMEEDDEVSKIQREIEALEAQLSIDETDTELSEEEQPIEDLLEGLEEEQNNEEVESDNEVHELIEDLDEEASFVPNNEITVAIETEKSVDEEALKLAQIQAEIEKLESQMSVNNEPVAEKVVTDDLNTLDDLINEQTVARDIEPPVEPTVVEKEEEQVVSEVKTEVNKKQKKEKSNSKSGMVVNIVLIVVILVLLAAAVYFAYEGGYFSMIMEYFK